MGEIVSLNYVVSQKENTCFSFKPIHCIGFLVVYHLTQTKVDIHLWVAESSYCFLSLPVALGFAYIADSHFAVDFYFNDLLVRLIH